MDQFEFTEISNKKIEEVLSLLETRKEGLTDKEVEWRINRYGKNTIPTKETKWWQVALRQLKSIFIYFLMVAVFISVFMKEYTNALLISIFVFINLFLGFIQEYQAENSLKLLKKFLTHKTRVIRDGKKLVINSEDLTVGDIVYLKAGDMIPADGYFIYAKNVTVDESPLTGESNPVNKISGPLVRAAKSIYEAKNIGFLKTTLISGEAILVVFAVGAKTMVGKLAEKIKETNGKSAFEIGMARFGYFIFKTILVIVPLIFIFNLIIKKGDLHIGEFLIFLIALIVSIIPEALPLVTTLTIARGALHLAKKKVVSRRLSAIEDLGNIQILCVDKTGTITENKLELAEILGDKKETIEAGLISSIELIENFGETKDVYNKALKKVADFDFEKWKENVKILKKEPFDPQTRKESVLIDDGKNKILYTRGAPEVISNPRNFNNYHLLEEWIKKEGNKGRRVLAMGKKIFPPTYDLGDLPLNEEDVEFIGAVSFVDPLKPSAKQTIKEAKHLGITVKIITGDRPEVAGWVAYEAGIIDDPSKVITAEAWEKMSPDKKLKAVKEYHVFARVLPLQKYEILELLQREYFVGFLGEGFNDVPALKLAHVAMVVEGGADIAQDASDIVLLNKNLEVIIDGIKEGRKIFTNTLKYIKATLISNFGNFFALVLASSVIPWLPMLPIQILLLNLLSDFPMVSIAADAVDKKDLRQPKTYNVRELAFFTIILGFVSTIFDFAFFGFFSRYDEKTLQTMWFIGSLLTELVLLFSIRTSGWFFKAKRPSLTVSLITVFVAVLGILIPFSNFGQTFFSFKKPSLSYLLAAIIIVLVYFIVTEIVKNLLHKFLENDYNYKTKYHLAR